MHSEKGKGETQMASKFEENDGRWHGQDKEPPSSLHLNSKLEEDMKLK